MRFVLPILEVIFVVIPSLLTVAFVTVAERKTMGSMQRRLGPNSVGFYGLLQAFADALKLLLKEYVAPTQSNIILFFLGPVITLLFSLLGIAVIPYAKNIALLNFDLTILYFLAVSSLATYGILLAGWSANSKYAFLGSLRSTAQLISYELILSSAVLLVAYLPSELNLIMIVEAQKAIWFIFPLFPVFIIFFIGSIAETNRAPFDLAEAESELVSGFMTEHSSVIFVFFFLAEYASLVLMCILTSLLFLGGYNINNDLLILPLNHIYNFFIQDITSHQEYLSLTILKGLTDGTILAIKSCILIFTFIWIRASFPRIRYDQLMSFCWTILLPIVIAIIILVPCIIYSLDFMRIK
jgi:NADH-ubiquinone oxidoreductase chain 1